MPNATDLVLIEITSEIAVAHVANTSVPPAEPGVLLASIRRTLIDLGRPPPVADVETRPTPLVPVRKSIGDDFIVSTEDGKRFTSLKRHPAKQGLKPAASRAKWSLPHDYPMVTAAYAHARSALAKDRVGPASAEAMTRGISRARTAGHGPAALWRR